MKKDFYNDLLDVLEFASDRNIAIIGVGSPDAPPYEELSLTRIVKVYGVYVSTFSGAIREAIENSPFYNLYEDSPK